MRAFYQPHNSPLIVFFAGCYNAPMPKPAKKKTAPDREHDNERLIAHNRKARYEYEVLDTLECGIVLVGSEVKSLRGGRLSLDEAYGRVKDGEVFLMGCDIAEYVQANRLNHQPRRPRKLLMHRREVKKFAGQAFEKGLTLVPLKMYFKEGRGEGAARHLPRQKAARQARIDERRLHEARHPTRRCAATDSGGRC